MQVLTIILQYTLAIIGLSLIIIAHELGHFFSAKMGGIYVEEFFIGFGPKIFKFKSKGGTAFGIRAIPVGGYNKLLGMDREEAIPSGMKDRAFGNKPFYKKFLVCIGGSAFNIILAVILIGIFLSFAAPTTIIDYIKPGSSADINGFRVGDRFIALNDRQIESWDDFSAITKEYPGEEVTYTVTRDGKALEIKAVLGSIEGQGYLGISPSYSFSPRYALKEFGFFGLIKESFKITWDISVFYVKAIGMLFSGKIPISEARPVSPVGVISIFQQSASIGIQNFIFLVALVSILLGFGNLIPILPLDGGNIVLIIIESIRKKPVPKKFLVVSNSIGIFILISILIIGFVFDVITPFNISNI